MKKLFLLVVAAILVPVALSYGVDLAAVLPKFMIITVEGTDETHIFTRADVPLSRHVHLLRHRRPAWRHVAVIRAVSLCSPLQPVG